MTRHEPAPPLHHPLSADGAPRFKWERFSAIARELIPLWQRHWNEVASFRDVIPFDPDFDQFYRLDLEGLLHVLTVRVDGRLVGYTFTLVGPHLLFKSTRSANTIFFWLAPEHRAGWTGVRLLRLTRRGIKDRGVKLHTINALVEFQHGRVARLLARLGYKATELVLQRML